MSPNHPGIAKDPSIGAQTEGCLRYSNGCHGSSWNSKLAILSRRNKSTKSSTSCEYVLIDTNFVSILLLVSVIFSQTF